MGKAKSRTWVWHFDRPVAEIWPILSDTARFNEAAKLPKHHIDEQLQDDNSVRYFGSAKVGPMQLRWEEKPVNWVHEDWFEHCRHFSTGPIDFLCARLRIFPEPDGCRVEYTAEAAARNFVGKFLLSTDFFPRIGRTFEPLANSAREFARGNRETQFDTPAPKLQPGAKARADRLVDEIESTRHGHGLARRLADYVLNRCEVDLWNIRPIRLARLWGVDELQAIEVCLEAVKQGLLGVRWDLLCPRCQVSKSSVVAMDQLPQGAHCGTCNIDYDRDFSNNVELAFHPASAIRPIENGEYCLFGPMSTPHIKVQLTLQPGEERQIDIELIPGVYRVRTLEPGGEQTFEWRDGGFPQVIATGSEVVAQGESPARSIVLQNNSERRVMTLIIEDRVWERDALTAKRATSLQAFRDLFTEAVLRPGDHVDIDYISLMFTDLKGSTALYERIGDPQAYALVREHFALLAKSVRDNHGAVVKTIGDAIMASFVDPRDALLCAIQIQTEFEQYNLDTSHEPAVIKIGIHSGRCISVTLNNRLDYYGTAANKAARLQGQSVGGDIVLSPEFIADPTTAELVNTYPSEEEFAKMKGFDEPVRFYRIHEATLRAKRSQH